MHVSNLPEPLRRLIRNRGVMLVLVLFLGAVVLNTHRNVEGVGDNLQIALPLAGLGCAIASGQGVRYTGRFVLMGLGYTASKRGLGEAEINARPNGGYHGFPSAHTSASTFGAVGLMQTCLAANPPAQALAAISAGFVGGTRIEVGAHDVWQVLAGALWGWIVQIGAFVAFDRWFARIWFGAGRGILAGLRAVLKPFRG